MDNHHCGPIWVDLDGIGRIAIGRLVSAITLPHALACRIMPYCISYNHILRHSQNSFINIIEVSPLWHHGIQLSSWANSLFKQNPEP